MHVRFESDESVNGLTCQLIGGTDDRSLSDTLVEDESGFDLSCGETVTRDIDDIYFKEIQGRSRLVRTQSGS